MSVLLSHCFILPPLIGINVSAPVASLGMLAGSEREDEAHTQLIIQPCDKYQECMMKFEGLLCSFISSRCIYFVNQIMDSHIGCLTV